MLLHIIKDGMIVLPFFCIFYTSVSILGCCWMIGLVSKADAFNIKFCHCVNINSCQRFWRTLYFEVFFNVVVICVLTWTCQEDENIRLQYLYLLRDDMEVFFLQIMNA